MKAVFLTGPNEFSIQDVAEPIPKRDEVLIQVRMAGICGTDVHLLRGRNPFAKYPLIPGHEFMGEVLKAPTRSKLKKGDKVTVFPEVGCGKCPACRGGRLVHCPEFKFVGVHLPGGGFCERVAAPYQRVFPLPRKMEDKAGAMVEPTAVAAHANKRAGIGHGRKVVIIGGGTIGLLIAQVARAYGASKVVLSEPIADRRKIARALGFQLICNPNEEELPSFVRNKIGFPDVVFDVVGTVKTLDGSQSMTRPNGKIVLIALPHTVGLGVPYLPIFAKELQIIGSRTYFMKDFPEAIRLLNSKKVRVHPIISQILPLEKFAEALDHLEKEPEKYVKILIQPPSYSERQKKVVIARSEIPRMSTYLSRPL
jgi:2-desacetyl-2-hydroxyethyl bacteriochlorophyllide A dehydrogenase